MSDEHLGGAYPDGDANTWMPDVWGYLAVKYGVKSVLDVGCGFGYTVQWFGGIGIHAIGIEGDPVAVAGSKVPTNTFKHDYTVGPAPEAVLKPTDCFDLGWSAEFLEHVDAEFMPHYMHSFKHCRHVCVTHAVPGQDGFHHVNCQTDYYWIEAFARSGFIFDPVETVLLRATDRYRAPWGRCTLMLFHRI